MPGLWRPRHRPMPPGKLVQSINFNRIIDDLNRLDIVGLQGTADGIPPWAVEVGTGQTVVPPSGSDDFTTGKYWVAPTTLSNSPSGGLSAVVSLTQDATPTSQPILVMTHLSELISGTHSLDIGTDVLYFGFLDGNSIIRYLFVVDSPGRMFPATVAQVGGSNGSYDVMASWTYDILINDTVVANDVPLDNGGFRCLRAYTTPADEALIFTVPYDPGGYGTNPNGGPQFFRIWSANEAFGEEECD